MLGWLLRRLLGWLLCRMGCVETSERHVHLAVALLADAELFPCTWLVAEVYLQTWEVSIIVKFVELGSWSLPGDIGRLDHPPISGIGPVDARSVCILVRCIAVRRVCVLMLPPVLAVHKRRLLLVDSVVLHHRSAQAEAKVGSCIVFGTARDGGHSQRNDRAKLGRCNGWLLSRLLGWLLRRLLSWLL